MTTAAEKLDEGNKSAGKDAGANAAGDAHAEKTGEKAAGPAAVGTAIGTAAATPPDKRRALGRGLESLLGGPRVVAPATPGGFSSSGPRAGAPAPAEGSNFIGDLSAAAARPPRTAGEEVEHVPIAAVAENPYQTRTYFGPSLMEELAASIKAHGLLQPIVVRPGKDGNFVLILGERRLRAAKLAGLEKIPAIVRRVNNEQAAEMTVIENIQRQDLRCMEQAAAFAMLSQEFGLTQEEIGKKTGVSRETVSNYMRLLKLPPEVHRFLNNRDLEFSHARELLNLLDPTLVVKIAEQAVKQSMSVLQLERLVFDTNVPLQKQADAIRRGARWVDPNVKAAQRQLEEALGVRVRIRDRKGKGKIVIEYATIEDFDRVVEMLKGSN